MSFNNLRGLTRMTRPPRILENRFLDYSLSHHNPIDWLARNQVLVRTLLCGVEDQMEPFSPLSIAKLAIKLPLCLYLLYLQYNNESSIRSQAYDDQERCPLPSDLCFPFYCQPRSALCGPDPRRSGLLLISRRLISTINKFQYPATFTLYHQSTPRCTPGQCDQTHWS
jgi:hypothetical protein